jgi:hypothetical protein
MQKIFFYTCAIGLLAVAGCKKYKSFTGKDGDVKIYMAQRVSSTDGYTTVNVVTRTSAQADSAFTFDVNAYLSGSGYSAAPNDIPVTFKVDYAKWDSINTARTNAGLQPFEKIPDSVFSFTNTSSTIPKNSSLSDDIGFSISSKKIQLNHNYMVPISITTAGNGYALNTGLSTAYFIIKVSMPVYPDIDRAGWTIHDFNSQEPSGEGPNNGRAIFAIDGLLTTFWHTQWDGGEPPPPHHISIDMHATKTLLGVTLTHRQNVSGGRPKTITVYVSNNGTTWTAAGTFSLASVNAKQYALFAAPQSARYFRVVVTETINNSNSTFLAEIGAV